MNASKNKSGSGFAAWMKKVDGFISAKLGGLDSNDLPDKNYMIWYEDGMSAKSAAVKAIKDEDY